MFAKIFTIPCILKRRIQIRIICLDPYQILLLTTVSEYNVQLFLLPLPAHCETFRSRAGCPCTSGQWGRSRGTRPCTRNTRRKYFIIRAGSLAIFRANTLNGKGSLSGRVITGTIVSPFLTEYIFTWVLLTSVDIFRTINNFSKNLL